jgi:hypothetical protein
MVEVDLSLFETMNKDPLISQLMPGSGSINLRRIEVLDLHNLGSNRTLES